MHIRKVLDKQLSENRRVSVIVDPVEDGFELAVLTKDDFSLTGWTVDMPDGSDEPYRGISWEKVQELLNSIS
jgi:hypothetical protein